MKVILQRVTNAKVSVNGEEISSIGRGVCALVGLCRDDTEKEVDYIVRKMLSFRMFENEEKKPWSKSVSDLNLEIMCVSQFTLYYTFKGNKPDFRHAMGTEEAKSLYNKFIAKLGTSYKPNLIKNGVFGAYMQVDITNDGPVTFEIESPAKPSSGE